MKQSDFDRRLERHLDELRWLYMELYDNGAMFAELCGQLNAFYWKELGTDCRNRPQVHTIVRMMRMIGEIVCPSVILLGEVVMEPVKVVPYFGTVEKPECHLLYNAQQRQIIRF